MADYKELLRRAVEALPENNGAARRAVYEKARAALVGQLRAINPPLPARDITTHRLQLEDCIRQVEQEASEAVIAGMGQEPPAPKAEAPVVPIKTAPPPKSAESDAPPAPPAAARKGSIEDIIAAAERDGRPAPQKIEAKAPELKARPPKSAPVLVARNNPPPPAAEPEDEFPTEGRPIARTGGRPLPSIVAKAEAAKAKPASGPVFGTPIDGRGRGAGLLQPRRDVAASASGAAMMRQVDPVPFQLPEDREAMSAVREVDVENGSADPQVSIDRAIATLDREARGDDMDDEPMQAPRRGAAGKQNGSFVENIGRDEARNGRGGKPSKPAREFATPRRTGRGAEGGVPRAMQERERRGLGAVAIFLIVFVVLLLGAGGAGIWAWQEGFINVDAMFGKNQADVQATDAAVATPNDVATGPGNTETPATTETSTELKADARLPAAATDTAPAESVAPLALQTPAGEAAKTEERLSTASSAESATAAAASASLNAAAAPGSQSLLLEASDSGTTGAVPFSGTVDWSKGTDENGQPTLVGKANIPARNLSVDILIRKNSDPQLPASHLMEINFSVSNSFVGGSIAGLPGVLLKNEELVQGTPLVGASARVVGNSFLFALSAVPSDSASNVTLLTSRKWIDLALIYASGKRAIITLEKDAAAEKLFDDVFASWGKAAAN